MNLSNILFNNISNKLKFLTNKKNFYIKNLFNQIYHLEQIKKKNYKKLSTKIVSHNSFKQNLTVFYVINISFLKANTIIHLSDIKGNIKLFYSAGEIGVTGKQKTKRRTVITKLITLLLRKATFIKNKPVALHLSNVKFYKRLILKQLKKNVFIALVKSFNLIPYNGCRKKKLRRKKYTKKLK